MSRSSSSRGRLRPWVVVGVLTAVTAAPLAPAAAEDTAPVEPIVAPVVTMVAPVLDIQFGESDLRSEARVEQLPRRTTVTLDATVPFAKDSATINARGAAGCGRWPVSSRLAVRARSR